MKSIVNVEVDFEEQLEEEQLEEVLEESGLTVDEFCKEYKCEIRSDLEDHFRTDDEDVTLEINIEHELIESKDS